MFIPVVCSAKIYQCEIQGRTVYQDNPCPDDFLSPREIYQLKKQQQKAAQHEHEKNTLQRKCAKYAKILKQCDAQRLKIANFYEYCLERSDDFLSDYISEHMDEQQDCFIDQLTSEQPTTIN